MTSLQHFARAPLVAILRGLTPREAPAIAAALVEGGIRTMEAPLNSPEPLQSISAIASAFGPDVDLGAGTVRTAEEVMACKGAGARFIVSPNAEPAVITATKAAGLISFPGVFTPTEAFSALKAGADALKLFPANAAGTAHLEALRSVLPRETTVLAVGGIDETTFAVWRKAGASGFGVGGSLYQPGMSPAEVLARAKALRAAFDATFAP